MQLKTVIVKSCICLAAAAFMGHNAVASAQTVEHLGTYEIEESNPPNFQVAASNLAEGWCPRSPGYIFDGMYWTQSPKGVLEGFSSCRRNLSSTQWVIYQYMFWFQSLSGPPNLEPKCVGACWPPDPKPIATPLAAPYAPY